jgi:AcrR family transcriptional regulator
VPYPSQIDREMIIETAARLLESSGAEELSMGSLAESLGVTPQSLYRYVDSKSELLKAVNIRTLERLFEALVGALVGVSAEAEEQLLIVCQVYRQFAVTHPHSYRLAMESVNGERPDQPYLNQLALPLQTVTAEIAGVATTTPALLGIWALVHGFVMLELGEQFDHGGDPDEVFIQCVSVYVTGWQGWGKWQTKIDNLIAL